MHRHPVLPSRIRPATLSGLRLLGALALLLAFLVPGVSPVLAAGTLDQQQTDTAGGNVQCFGPPAALGQTFTAGLTGNLDQVDLFISVGAPSVINVQIRNVVGGVVGPTVLASTTASPPVAFAPTAFFSIPIPGGAPVVAGTQYAIVFDCPVPVIIALFSTSDSYPPGQATVSLTGIDGPYINTFFPAFLSVDLAFRTFVTRPTLSVGNASVTEGNGGTTNLVFPVTLPFAVGAPVTATFSLANGSASGGPNCATNVDFVNASGTVTIPAGSTSGTATVTVCGDTTLEADETLTLTLANPTNAVLGTATATGTILNDDAAPVIPAAPGQADVRITKTGPANATLGSSPVYTITVTNAGPATAENVTVNDPVPTGLTFVSNTGACTTVFPCALGSLAAGQTRVITTTLNVPNGYGGPDPIRNVATVTTTTADPNLTNNTAEARTTPQGNVNDPNNNGKGDKKDKDETSKPTEEQQLNQQHTNTGGKDQYATGGGVSHVEKTPDGQYLLVTLKQTGGDSLVVAFACPNGQCPDIIVNDQIEVDGKQGGDLPEQKGWLMAESFNYVTKAPR